MPFQEREASELGRIIVAIEVLAQRAASEGPRWTRAVEDQSAPIPEELTSELGRTICRKSRASSGWIHGAGYAGQHTQQLGGIVETARIISAVGTSQGQATVLGVGDTRVNLSFPHLLSAASFSCRLGELESENEGKQLGDFWDGIFAQSSAVVFAAVAALEAYANELFIDHSEVFPELRDEVMAKLWELYEQKPPLEKYEFVLLLKQSAQLDKGSSPYQDVSALVKLRNALIPFKPEWFSEQVEHARLSRILVHRAMLSPFFPQTEPLFPRGWASHGTAVWAIKSVVSFILKFEENIRIRPRMEKFKDRFNTL